MQEIDRASTLSRTHITRDLAPPTFNETVHVMFWNHPVFYDVHQKLNECDYIKYPNYRLAAKIRVLQNIFQTNSLPLTLSQTVFIRHKLGATEGSLLLDPTDLEAILSDLYACAAENHMDSINPTSINLILSFMFNVYDRSRSGKIQVLSVKVCLGVLCNTSLTDLYKYMHTLCSDHNNLVTQRRFKLLLQQLSQITEFLQEGATFGPDAIATAARDCFANANGVLGISENQFLKWFGSMPHGLSWLPILNRMKMAEKARHNTMCTSCHIQPIEGFKYKCTKCRKFVQCQMCYFSARVTHAHKLKHAMQEFCTEEHSRELRHIITNKIKNFVKCSSKPPLNRSIYSNNTLDCTHSAIVTFTEDTSKSTCGKSTNDLTVVSDIQQTDERLTAIIKQLEIQNRKLNYNLQKHSESSGRQTWQWLDEHRAQIAIQIQKLKLVKECLSLNDQPIDHFNKQTSTPRTNSLNKPKYLHMLSPIVQSDTTTMYETANDVLDEPRELSKAHSRNSQPSSRSHSNSHSNPDDDTYTSLDTNSYVLDSIASRSGCDLTNWNDGTNSRSLWTGQLDADVSRGRGVKYDLDTMLERLQDLLANNYCFDETGTDNGKLQRTVSEMEGMLTSIIDGVERRKSATGGQIITQ